MTSVCFSHSHSHSHTHTRTARKEGHKWPNCVSKHDVITVHGEQFKGHSLFADPHTFLETQGLPEAGQD